MKIKKITALAVGASVIGLTAGAGAAAAQKISAPHGIPKMNINNVEVVLPTTPEVNGVPLQIKNDAASAILLISQIYQDSVLMDVNVVKNSLSPVAVGGEISNYVTNKGQIVSIAAQPQQGPIYPFIIFYGVTINYDANGDPSTAVIYGTTFNIIQDTNGNYYIDLNNDGSVDMGDIKLPANLASGPVSSSVTINLALFNGNAYEIIYDSTLNEYFIDIDENGQADLGDIGVPAAALADNPPNILLYDYGAKGPSPQDKWIGAKDIDLDLHFFIPNLDAPVVPLGTNLYASGKPEVAFGINFKDITWISPASGSLSAIEESHKGQWELHDGAIMIGWALPWSPLKPNPNDDVVLSTKNTSNGPLNVIYYYKNFVPNPNPLQISLGNSVTVDNWQVKALDISINLNKADILVQAPNGKQVELTVQIDQNNPYTYIFWINSNGNLVHWSDDQYDMSKTTQINANENITATTPQGVIQQLEQAGVGTIFIVSPYSDFVGVNKTKNVSLYLSAKDLKNTYTNGEKVVNIFPQFAKYPDSQNWYLKIDPNNGNPIVYFVWKSVYDPQNPDYANFPPVFFQPGDKIYIPIPYYQIVGTGKKAQPVLKTEVVTFQVTAKLNQTGDYWDPTTAKFYIEYFQNQNKYYNSAVVDSELSQLMNQIQASDPTQAIMTDQQVDQSGFQAGKNYIIIGGWVSNKAWQELAKYYPQQVAEMKQYLLSEVEQGKATYIIYVLPNPADSNDVIIVAAGTDHQQTRDAIEYIIQHLGQ